VAVGGVCVLAIVLAVLVVGKAQSRHRVRSLGIPLSPGDSFLTAGTQPSDPCSLLSSSEISRALGARYVLYIASDRASVDNPFRTCNWSGGPDGLPGFGITTQTQEADDITLAAGRGAAWRIGDTAAQTFGMFKRGEAVSSVGDAANYLPSNLIVLSGTTVLWLQGYGQDVPLSALKPLALRAITRLPGRKA